MGGCGRGGVPGESRGSVRGALRPAWCALRGCHASGVKETRWKGRTESEETTKDRAQV